jgi:hypothetical protein
MTNTHGRSYAVISQDGLLSHTRSPFLVYWDQYPLHLEHQCPLEGQQQQYGHGSLEVSWRIA